MLGSSKQAAQQPAFACAGAPGRRRQRRVGGVVLLSYMLTTTSKLIAAAPAGDVGVMLIRQRPLRGRSMGGDE